jgi:hypothetical protein
MRVPGLKINGAKLESRAKYFKRVLLQRNSSPITAWLPDTCAHISLSTAVCGAGNKVRNQCNNNCDSNLIQWQCLAQAISH